MSNSIGKKIDISRIDLDELKEKTTADPGLIEFAHTVGGALIKPTDQGRIKGTAVASMHDQTSRQYKQLYDQMQVLVKQAQELKSRVEISERIYLAKITFQPVVNHTYFLYQRKDGSDFLSMVGPEEWGRLKPFEVFLAEVKLLSDHTWEVVASEHL